MMIICMSRGFRYKIFLKAHLQLDESSNFISVLKTIPFNSFVHPMNCSTRTVAINGSSFSFPFGTKEEGKGSNITV